MAGSSSLVGMNSREIISNGKECFDTGFGQPVSQNGLRSTLEVPSAPRGVHRMTNDRCDVICTIC